MKRCDRCQRWFREGDSAVCDPCWEDMGQMTFWHDEEDDWEDPRIERADPGLHPASGKGLDRHPIDSAFDQ